MYYVWQGVIQVAKQDAKKINEWKAANITRLNIEVRKDSGILERVQEAVNLGKAKSRQAYIVKAICDALERDGIPEIEEDPDAE